MTCKDFDTDCFDMTDKQIHLCQDYQPERGRCFFLNIFAQKEEKEISMLTKEGE